MGDLVKYSGRVPVQFRASIEARFIEPVVGVVGSTIAAVALEGIEVTKAIVIAYRGALAEVAFYDERNRVYRTEVVDVVAAAAAWKIGNRQLAALGLPPEVQARFQRDLDQRFWG